MRAVSRALWFIESHLGAPLDLGGIAAEAGLSRFHLARCFAQVTGMSVGTYLRARRMTVGARALADTPGDILSVALANGYGSHEAFTRAFRARFGVTPEHVRCPDDLSTLDLQEAITMTATNDPALGPPEIREEGPFLMVGYREHRRMDDLGGIPGQWARFNAHHDEVTDVAGPDGYGISLDMDADGEGFDYMAALAVTGEGPIPVGMVTLRIPRQRYAVFRHADHVSSIGATCARVFADWLPGSGERAADRPVTVVEHYDRSFDPDTGRGGIWVWLPLADSSGP